MPRAQNKNIRFRFDATPVQSAGGDVLKLYIYDDVTASGSFNWNTWEWEESETSAKYMRDQLDTAADGADIEVHINSAGGEVAEGVTIYNLLKQKAQEGHKIIGYIDGMAYSVAMVIAMACSEIHMGLGTSMLLHYPWMYCAGNAEELRNAADQLDALGESSLQLFLHRSAGKVSYEDLDEMMRKETMLDPETCLKYGFADVIDDYTAPSEPAETPEEYERTIAQLRRELSARDAGTQEIRQMLTSLRPQRNEPEEIPEEKAVTPEPEVIPEEPRIDMHKVMVAAMKKAAERR